MDLLTFKENEVCLFEEEWGNDVYVIISFVKQFLFHSHLC